MKSLILAAGIGSRLGEITKELPKCLVPVAGKPILEYQLDALLANGITEVALVLGYQKEKILAFLESKEKYKSMTFTFALNLEYATTNSSYSYWQARSLVGNEPYIHLNSDIVLFPPLIKRLKESTFENAILVDRKVKLDASMEQVILEEDNVLRGDNILGGDRIVKKSRIVKMDKANLPGAMGRGSGMAKLSPVAVAVMKERVEGFVRNGDKNQHCHGLMRHALTKVPFYALDAHDLFFREINDKEELQEAEEAIRKQKF